MDDRKLGTLFGVLCLVALLALAVWATNPPAPQASDEELPWVVVDPAAYPTKNYATATIAAGYANQQLSAIEDGNIETIDTQCDYFGGELLKVSYMGNKIVWNIFDDNVTVWMDAFDDEIVQYFRTGKFSGSIDQGTAQTTCEDIVDAFCDLPDDADVGNISLETLYEEGCYDPLEESWGYVNVSSWKHTYNRIYDGIQTTDRIYTLLNTDGTLAFYEKDWYMDLNQLSTEYSVTQAEAEETCADWVERGNLSISSEKRIVRPNAFYNYDDNINITFTANPVCVWEVKVSLLGDDVNWMVNGTWYNYTYGDNWEYTFHVHFITGDIVGGYWERTPEMASWMDGIPEDYRWD